MFVGVSVSPRCSSRRSAHIETCTVYEGGGHVGCKFVVLMEDVLCFKCFKIRDSSFVVQELIMCMYNLYFK